MATIIPSTITPTIGTPTQNTSGYPEIVFVTGTNSTTGVKTLAAVCDASATPTTPVANTSIWSRNPAIPLTTYSTIAFVVQPNYYWTITGTVETISSAWLWQLQSGAVNDPGDLVAVRAVGTIYRNTTGNAILLIPQFSTVNSNIQVLHDSSSPPTSIVWDQSTLISNPYSPYVLIPNGHYYKVTGTSATINHWREYQLPFQATRSDITASRALTTIYQNTTTESLWEVPVVGTSGGGVGQRPRVLFNHDTVTPPVKIESEWADPAAGNSETLSSLVGVNYYQEITFPDANVGSTLTKWWEYSFSNAPLTGTPIVQFANP
jgi:hypothetical protein